MSVDEIEALLHLVGADVAVRQLLTAQQLLVLQDNAMWELRIKAWREDNKRARGSRYLQVMAEQVWEIINVDTRKR